MQTCQSCEKETDLIYCNSCHLQNIQFCLDSPNWVKIAKTRKGDLPNENLFQTLTREKEQLELQLQVG